MKLTLWVNIAAQSVLGAGEVLNLVAPFLSERQKVIITAILSVASVIVSRSAHFVNTDGSPQTAAFVAKEK